MNALVNMPDLNRETPMDYVQRNTTAGSTHHRIEAAEEDLRTKMFVTLVTCGAGGDSSTVDDESFGIVTDAR